MQAAARKLVLFDFDGVIADTFLISWSTSGRICKRLTREDYSKAFEGNINDSYAAIMLEDHPECNHGLDWYETYIPQFEREAKLFAGITDVIEKLSHSYLLIVVSSSVSSPIQGFLEKHGIGRYFSEIMGNDVHQHKTEKIKMVFEKYHAVADDCVFVTDTLGDMKEATKMNVGAIGVTWGFHSRETLEKGNPFRIVEKPADIPGAIEEYFETK